MNQEETHGMYWEVPPKNGRIDEGNITTYYKDGQYHREGGPTIITLNTETLKKTEEWYVNGQRHREDGPAVITDRGEKYWYLNDVEMTREDFDLSMELKSRVKRNDLYKSSYVEIIADEKNYKYSAKIFSPLINEWIDVAGDRGDLIKTKDYNDIIDISYFYLQKELKQIINELGLHKDENTPEIIQKRKNVLKGVKAIEEHFNKNFINDKERYGYLINKALKEISDIISYEPKIPKIKETILGKVKELRDLVIGSNKKLKK